MNDLQTQLNAALSDKAALEALVVRKDEALRACAYPNYCGGEREDLVAIIRKRQDTAHAALAETPAGLSDKLKATEVLCAELRDAADKLCQILFTFRLTEMARRERGEPSSYPLENPALLAALDACINLVNKAPRDMGAELARLRESEKLAVASCEEHRKNNDTLRQQLSEREKEIVRLTAVTEDFPSLLASIADYVNVLARESSVGETPNFQVGNIKEAMGRIYDARRARVATLETDNETEREVFRDDLAKMKEERDAAVISRNCAYATIKQLETQRDALIAAGDELRNQLHLWKHADGWTMEDDNCLSAWDAAKGAPIEAKPAESDLEQALKERDDAEAVADKLTSLILDEPIDWPFHDAKWAEAIEAAPELSGLREDRARLDWLVAEEARVCRGDKGYYILWGDGDDAEWQADRYETPHAAIDAAMKADAARKESAK